MRIILVEYPINPLCKKWKKPTFFIITFFENSHKIYDIIMKNLIVNLIVNISNNT